MKCIHIALGAALGMAVSAAAMCCAYPDVSRRMMRDGRRVVRRCKCGMQKMMP